jgi:hypothetical protein
MKPRPTATPWLVSAFLAGLLVAWMVTPSRGPAPWVPSPIPSPHESRPVIAAIVRFAKAAGWMLIFADPAPVPADAVVERVIDDPDAEPAEVGSDGYAALRNARGW